MAEKKYSEKGKWERPVEEEREEEEKEYKEEEDVYDEESREEALEADAIQPLEEGFMKGAEGAGKLGGCANCGKPLDQDKKKVIEREINDKICWFCSDKCASEFK